MDSVSCDSILLIIILGLIATSSFATRTTLNNYGEYIFDVTKFGAVGDGENDDVQAFELAWKTACESGTNNVAIVVPGGQDFLISQIVFRGSCKPTTIYFMILGNIVAPPKSAWLNQSAIEWLKFFDVDGLIVDGDGKGIINGRGETWWNLNAKVDNSSRPATLRFYGCNNFEVRGLKYVNSPMNHLSLNFCNKADVGYLMIEAPDNSPNTDGIDIGSSTELYIHDIIMETGDDCIAINGGTSNINISNIWCGPGHGISIGSLGKNGKHEEVNGIFVSSCTFRRAKNGVRIKTWQGGSGFAKNIVFSDIKFSAVDNPIIIDQYYCPHMKCPDQVSAVKISDVWYTRLYGTSTNAASIKLNCSKTVSCDNIVLTDIDIRPAEPDLSNKAICANVNGKAVNIKNPVMDCVGELSRE